MLVGIIGALTVEIETLLHEIKDIETETYCGIAFHKGRINDVEVVAAVCGVGKVNAAICAQTLIMKYSPDYVINTGVAGALSKDLKIGDIVIADSVVQHDLDTTSFGDPLGFVPTVNTVNMKCSEKLNEILQGFHDEFKHGVVATGDQFINNTETLTFIAQNFQALCVEMEGGSIGQVCCINNVDFAIIRCISDNANENSDFDFRENLKETAKKTTGIIVKLLSELCRRENSMEKIDSFNIDHRKLTEGIYISRTDGDIVTYDIRTRKPNAGDYMDNGTMHSVEHLFATMIRNSSLRDDVIYFGPMGCQTGFYLLVKNTDSKTVVSETQNIMLQIMDYNGSIPGNSEIECGNYKTLDLKKAKIECSRFYTIIESLKDVQVYLN